MTINYKKYFDEWKMTGEALVISFKKPCFWGAFIFTFTFFGTLMNLLSAGFSGLTILFQVDFSTALGMLGNAFFGLFGVNRTFLDWLPIFFICLIQAILIGLIVVVWRSKKRFSAASDALTSAGLVTGLAVLGAGCPTCGTSLLMPIITTIFSGSTLAIAGALSAIITILAIILALFAIKRVGTDAYAYLMSEKYDKIKS